MDTLKEYATQSILGAMQSVVVLYGLLVNATMMKTIGFPEYSMISRFGFVWLFAPIVWVVATIYLERTDHGFSKRFTLLTGVAVLVLLVWYFSLRASPGTLITTDQG